MPDIGHARTDKHLVDFGAGHGRQQFGIIPADHPEAAAQLVLQALGGWSKVCWWRSAIDYWF
jgi:hypothetical protein